MQAVVTLSGTTNWEKITSEQFDTLLKLGLDVINNTDDDRSFDQEICAIICSSFNILLIMTV